MKFYRRMAYWAAFLFMGSGLVFSQTRGESRSAEEGMGKSHAAHRPAKGGQIVTRGALFTASRNAQAITTAQKIGNASG